MVSVEYREAITEVLDILNHMKKSDTDRIPKKFKNFLTENQSDTYKPQLDHTKKLKDMNLKEKTRNILAVIYSHYWCDNDKKIEYRNLLKENSRKHQEELREKYNPDNLFNKKQEQIKEENYHDTLPRVLEEQEGIFNKIMKFIKNIFRRK